MTEIIANARSVFHILLLPLGLVGFEAFGLGRVRLHCIVARTRPQPESRARAALHDYGFVLRHGQSLDREERAIPQMIRVTRLAAVGPAIRTQLRVRQFGSSSVSDSLILMAGPFQKVLQNILDLLYVLGVLPVDASHETSAF